ncbi:hypothetical protein AB0C93_29795 [Streptomyces sp. NPDC048518]|uniref:hypothetical protein n=1 Tax=Streptomyces sp. NPDC048518 TaxID=3155029 RepID=UPI00340BCA04
MTSSLAQYRQGDAHDRRHALKLRSDNPSPCLLSCGLAPGSGEDDEDVVWTAAIDLFVLNTGNSYDAPACLFGVRNSFGFQPLAEDRGLPEDLSDGVRAAFIAWLGPEWSHSTTWITRAELAAADWDETGSSRAQPSRGRGKRHPLGTCLGSDADAGRAARPGERTARRLVRLTIALSEDDGGGPG